MSSAEHKRSSSRAHLHIGWLILFSSGFLFIGISENIRTIALPLMKRDLSLSDLELSGFMVIGGVASILSQLFAGKLTDRVGFTRVYQGSILCLIVALSLTYDVDRYIELLGFFFVFQVGITLYMMTSNVVIPTLGQRGGHLLTFCHGCYGLGAMLSPLIAGLSADEWRASYQVCIYPALFLWLSLLYLGSVQRLSLSSYTVKEDHSATSNSPYDSQPPRLRELASQRLYWLFVVLFGMSISAEVVSSSWLIYYLSETQSEAQRVVSGDIGIYLSIFYGLFTLGRFLGSALLPAGAEGRALSLALGSASALLVIGALSPSYKGAILALSGLSFALVFPMILILFNRAFPRHQTHILGAVISGGLIIFMGANAGVGLWCTYLSVQTAYLLMAGCSMTALGSYSLIKQAREVKL